MKTYYTLPEITRDGNQYLDRPVISRSDIVSEAIDGCLDLMYRSSYPSITLDEYKKQHEAMTKEEREKAHLYNAHYLPKKTYEAILEDFKEAYDFASPLPEIIEILKGYFKKPISTSWVKDEDGVGHKEYVNPEPMSEDVYKEAEKYLDLANGFYNWNMDLNSFLFNVSNFSPCSNRETVEKWHQEHGEPDFKLPDDSWWIDAWDDEPENFENEED